MVRLFPYWDLLLHSKKNIFHCVYLHVWEIQCTRVHAADTAATPNVGGWADEWWGCVGVVMGLWWGWVMGLWWGWVMGLWWGWVGGLGVVGVKKYRAYKQYQGMMFKKIYIFLQTWSLFAFQYRYRSTSTMLIWTISFDNCDPRSISKLFKRQTVLKAVVTYPTIGTINIIVVL